MREHLIKVVQSGIPDPAYVGLERRSDRRRSVRNQEFERLLSHFGLDRRARVDRRRVNSSWLIVSDLAFNPAEDVALTH